MTNTLKKTRCSSKKSDGVLKKHDVAPKRVFSFTKLFLGWEVWCFFQGVAHLLKFYVLGGFIFENCVFFD